jgi:hypothetical protein
MTMKSKKIKIESVRWELTPIFNEKYIDEDDLKSLSEIDDDDELLENLEDILRDGDFIYTSEGTDYLNDDYNGELNKIYVKSNEHSIYLTSAISIGNTTISTYIDNLMNKQIEELIKEHNSLKVESIKSIIRDIKIEKLLK